MDIILHPKKLSGSVQSIPSKSHAHRMLICAAFAEKTTTMQCTQTNRDIEATVDCLNTLGAQIRRTSLGYSITPVQNIPHCAELNCYESGSTLRFMLPLVGALGIDTVFHMEGRLPARPLSPLWEEMERMGCTLSRPTSNTIRCQGKLQPGDYVIPGNISSQYITGLLLALPHLEGNSHITITGQLESKSYVDLTCEVLRLFHVNSHPDQIIGRQPFTAPDSLIIEGDWSNAAFFLAAEALGNKVAVTGLSDTSTQGDRAIQSILPKLKENITISAADIPDLIPILAITAACNQGACFTDIQRLRLKESDRVATVIAMLESLRGKASATEDCLTVWGTGLQGGVVDSANDHRIAMSAAIAATMCQKPVIIRGAQCVNKSYPGFFEEYRRLGGNYEQYLR